MKQRKQSPRKWSFILVTKRKNHKLQGAIYWYKYKGKFNIMLSNRKGFISNYKNGYCTFSFGDLNHLYNHIRKHFGYHTLAVTKASRISDKALKKQLKKLNIK